MSQTVKGTIAGTGATSSIVGRKITINMDYSGTATVDIERQMPSGAWIKIVTGITADYSNQFESATMSAVRLNCTAFTNSVEYEMSTGPEG